MAARPYYRLFFIIGLISIASVLGAFIGVYLLFWALNTYGIWLYFFVGGAVFAVVVVLYLYELRKEKKANVLTQPEMPDSAEAQE